MSYDIHKVLKQYWGYDQFRPLQEDIINAVLGGKDTLALMPTGGGKSICFQVPAMAKDGLCIVITPLIALMKDQVQALKKAGVRAEAVFSGMQQSEISNIFDNCAYGNYKFLYLSPERLKTDLFKLRAEQLPVNLIAIDEAHCISQWGYDFRPAYLEISAIRQYYPDVPVLALTATATAIVKEDICTQLAFKNQSIFQKSFERSNLVYGVVSDQDKDSRLSDLVRRIKGTGIIYAGTRKETKEIANMLTKNGHRADFYHAGLEHKLRNRKYEDWMEGKTRVIVSTNAFGMGIDKADVRFVIHYDLPDSLEAYYQEAGRAGRDGKRAYVVAIVNENDKLQLREKLALKYPEAEEIKKTFHSLCNFLNIPVGSGQGMSFDFDLQEFCSKYQLKPYQTFNILSLLEKQSVISTTPDALMPSRVKILVNYKALYEFQVANKKYDALIKTLLRSHGGCFDLFVKINEQELAKKAEMSLVQVVKAFKELHQMDIVEYIPKKSKPQLIFNENRTGSYVMPINYHEVSQRKKTAEEKLEAVIEYAFNEEVCKSRILLQYFGEAIDKDCGHCSFCIQSKKDTPDEAVKKRISEKIYRLTENEPVIVKDLPRLLYPELKTDIRFVLKEMLDEDRVSIDPENRLKVKK